MHMSKKTRIKADKSFFTFLHFVTPCVFLNQPPVETQKKQRFEFILQLLVFTTQATNRRAQCRSGNFEFLCCWHMTETFFFFAFLAGVLWHLQPHGGMSAHLADLVFISRWLTWYLSDAPYQAKESSVQQVNLSGRLRQICASQLHCDPPSVPLWFVHRPCRHFLKFSLHFS